MLPFKNFGNSLSNTWCVSLTMTQLSFSGPGGGCRPRSCRVPKWNRVLLLGVGSSLDCEVLTCPYLVPQFCQFCWEGPLSLQGFKHQSVYGRPQDGFGACRLAQNNLHSAWRHPGTDWC